MNRPQQFDLLVFDWDGTLYDSTALIVLSIQRACVDLGLPAPSSEVAAYVIGMGLLEALQHAVPSLAPDRYAEMAQRYRYHYTHGHEELALFPGTLEMLQGLKSRHHWLGVATGKSRQGLDEALAHAQLKGLFDATRTADETASKPHPQMLQELMAEFGVAPERTLMIGDTTHDLLLAQNAGAASVAVGFGAHEPHMFEPHAPLYVAQSTADLARWLTQHA